MGTDGFTASIDGYLEDAKKKKRRAGDFGASETERMRDGAAGLLCQWHFESLSLAPLVLNMWSHYINPHAAQLFPLNASILKISSAVIAYTKPW